MSSELAFVWAFVIMQERQLLSGSRNTGVKSKTRGRKTCLTPDIILIEYSCMTLSSLFLTSDEQVSFIDLYIQVKVVYI